MFTCIEAHNYSAFRGELDEIAQLRHRVFVDRLDWVSGVQGREVDSFDALNPVYLSYRHPVAGVVACVRLLPTTGGNMLRDTFPFLLDGAAVPSCELVYESSRFCVDTVRLKQLAPDDIPSVTAGLLASMLEFGLARGLSSIVTVTDLRVERIVRHAGWVTRRLGSSSMVGDTRAVAIEGGVSQRALRAVRDRIGDHSVRLHIPAVAAA